MSESNGGDTAELAYLLWEKQGRPENCSAQNWSEAEYLSRLPEAYRLSTAGDREVDLRMRGLGPLTQNELTPNGDDCGRATRRKLIRLSCLAGAGMVIAAGVIFSFARKRH